MDPNLYSYLPGGLAKRSSFELTGPTTSKTAAVVEPEEVEVFKDILAKTRGTSLPHLPQSSPTAATEVPNIGANLSEDTLKILGSEDFNKTMNSLGVDLSSKNESQLKGLADNYKYQLAGKNVKEPSTDWGVKGLGGTLLGAGQLGLGILSYLDNKETAEKQRDLMDQQMKANKYNLQKAKDDSAHLKSVFTV